MDTLFITILHPDQTMYEGKASALTSVNDEGKFDILPMHANFISIIKEYIHIWEDKKTRKEFKIEKGIIKAVENKVMIFVGI